MIEKQSLKQNTFSYRLQWLEIERGGGAVKSINRDKDLNASISLSYSNAICCYGCKKIILQANFFVYSKKYIHIYIKNLNNLCHNDA